MGHDLPGVANSFTTDRPLAWFVWKTMNSISRAVPEVALQAIRKLITEQGFGPGDALPSQRDLALQLGVSRASLREALSSLSALGVVSIQPGKGVFVQSPVELSRGDNAPGWSFAAQASPLDIFQLRYALEGFAAGLAAEGMRPFAAIYSTFLQRAYDQVVHDVCIQNLPVRFAIDRAGLVGADGATHAGSFDITYLATLPNMVVMAAADEAELVHMTYTAAEYDAGPIAFRYPRGNGTGVPLPEVPVKLEIGKGRLVREGTKVAILSLGSRLTEALKAADTLEAKGLSTTVADLRFAKPLDEAMIAKLMRTHEVIVTVEEGSIGGLGAHVLTFASDTGLTDNGLKVRTLRLPDTFIDHDDPMKQYDEAGLNAPQIVDTVLKALKHNSTGITGEEARA